jgi:hypothetical protein
LWRAIGPPRVSIAAAWSTHPVRKLALDHKLLRANVLKLSVNQSCMMPACEYGAPLDCFAGHEWNNFTHDANELVTVVQGRMRSTLFELEPGGELRMHRLPIFTSN